MLHETLLFVVEHDIFFSWSFSSYIWMKAGIVLKCTNDINLKQQFWKVCEKCTERGGRKLITMFSAFKSDLLNSEVLFLLCALGSLSSLSLLCINRSPWECSFCSVLIPQLQMLSNLALVLPGLDRPMPCHRAMHGIPRHSLVWDFSMRFQTFVLWVDAAVENLLLILRIFRFISRVLKWDHCWSDIFWYKTRTRRPETWMISVFSDFTYYGNVYPCINLVYIVWKDLMHR